MESKSDFKRLKASYEGKVLDRVPYLEYWVFNQSVLESILEKKISPIKGMYACPLTPEDNIEFATRIGMDAVVIDFIWRPNNIMKESSKGTLNYVDGSIKNWDDLSSLEKPPGLSFLKERLDKYIELIKDTKLGLIHTFTGVFDPSYLSMGLEHFMLTLYDDKKLIIKLLDTFSEYLEKALNIVCKYSEVEVILFNDDIATGTGTLMSPKLMREFWFSRISELTEIPKKYGKIIAYHTDGNVSQIIPMLIEMGFDACHPIEPYANDIYKIKKEYGKDICLVGNIDITLLQFGTPEEIRKDVESHIDKLGPEGYIVSSSNSIISTIKPENFLAMTKAVINYKQ